MTSSSRLSHILARLALVAGLSGLVAACDEGGVNGRGSKALSSEMLALMENKGTTKNAPVLIRAYKKEAELEIWKMKSDGRYGLLKTYPMCRWSGQLGPKTREGDRQVPEGFYTITPGQMNPNSNYYLSFNVGYPNAYDRAHGRGGGLIMVHGACSSAGCFSMTDEQIAEIYAVAREGFNGGQRAIQMQSMPFRMSPENLAKHRADPHIAFWKQLKEGMDHFDVTKQEVAVNVCNRRYVFNANPADGSRMDANSTCPTLRQDETLVAEVAAKQARDEAKIAELSSSVKAVKVVYADGGQHPDFAHRNHDVSRPEALAKGPVEIALDDSQSKGKKPLSPVVQMAKPAAPIDGQTSVAKIAAKPASNALPAQASALAEDKPKDAKTDSSVFGGLFGSKPEAKPEAEPFLAPAASSQPAAQPAAAPAPPRRTSAVPNAKPKPQASVNPLEQMIRGGAQPLPKGFASYAPLTR